MMVPPKPTCCALCNKLAIGVAHEITKDTFKCWQSITIVRGERRVSKWHDSITWDAFDAMWFGMLNRLLVEMKHCCNAFAFNASCALDVWTFNLGPFARHMIHWVV